MEYRRIREVHRLPPDIRVVGCDNDNDIYMTGTKEVAEKLRKGIEVVYSRHEEALLFAQ